MRFLNRLMLVAAVVAVSAGTSLAQQGSILNTGGGQSLGSLSGTGGLAGGIGNGQLGGGSGGQGGGGLGGGQNGQTQGTALMQLEAAPTITAPGSTTGGGSGAVLDASNPFGGYYANPYYQGTWANSKSAAAPGGFGTALYGTTTAAGTSAGGRAGARTGTTGRAGIGGANSTANQNGTVVAMPVQIAYPAIPRFASTPISTPQIQADLTGMIARSAGTLSNPAGVQVATVGNDVTLRGSVLDEDEARLVENMVRMAPGVRNVKNELTFPANGLRR